MFKPVEPKPDFPKMEEEILKFWEENQIFEKSLEQTKGGKPFTFYDGPPFATGIPHYGHILASTVKDLFPRYQTMKGRFVRRRWGWDCHGLPIEEITERHLGISGKKEIEKIGIAKFNETCRSLVLQYVSEWRRMVRRIARWVDFDHSYKTMDRDYMESVWWAFKQIYDKGLVYEGRKVLLYCPRCETPVSNFEVAMDNSYETVKEEAVTVKFKVKPSTSASGLRSGSNKLMSELVEDSTYLLAWTTTPWTLPGNVALAVGNDIDYIKVKMGEEYYILASARVTDLHGRAELKQEFKGSDLVGLEYEPLFDVPAVKTLPTPPQEGGRGGVYRVYPADFVTTEEGTGIVHTAVVYGEEDYELGVREGLPVVPLLDEKGKFNDKAPELIRGMYFKDSEKVIVDDLQKRDLLLRREMHEHSYPHCWRCGTPLFYNAIPAWFINIQKIKDGLLKSNEKEINWFPSHLKHGRYQKSVESAPDWNISRNRYWGNPIPVWKCTACGENEVIGSIKELGLSRNTFYFMRHGRSEQNDLRLNDSWPDLKHYALTAKGTSQVESGVEKLKELGGVDLIFSSDITRCKQTAEIVGKLLDVEVKFDERLREVDCGEFNGKSYEEIWKHFSFENRWTKAPKGGETNVQIQKRMLSFIQEINNNHQNKKILIVGHGDPLLIVQRYFGSERPYPIYAEPYELDVSIADLHRPYIDEIKLKCEKCGGESRRITEIFDSWVEAGSMPFAEYHYPFDQKKVFEERLPAQFVAEYIAQTRAWFYVMHVVSLILFKKAPFENVVTTGTILAEDGSKMSKSRSNFPDPWEVINKYGVDALRFYLMNSVVMQADNLNFSERELAIVYRKVTLILWNIYNYFVTYANEAGWDSEENSKFKIQKSKLVIDEWILAKTQEITQEITAELDSYNTVKATRAMVDYLNDLSTWYLRRSRGRKDEEFFYVLRHCLLVTSKLLAPVTPYVSEEIFRNLNRRDISSVHLTSWLEAEELSQKQKDLLTAMDIVREAATMGLAARKQLKLNVRQPLSRLAVDTKSKEIKFTPELLEVLLSELNVKKVDPSLIEEAKTNNKIYGFAGSVAIAYFYLDTTVSSELKLEGLARGLERTVQEMRKNLGLRVGEFISLSYDTDDEELKAALGLFDTKKTYIKRVEGVEGVEGEAIDIDGKKIKLRLG